MWHGTHVISAKCKTVFFIAYLISEIAKCDHCDKVDFIFQSLVLPDYGLSILYLWYFYYLYCCTPLTKEKTSLYLPKWIKNVRVNLNSMYYPLNVLSYLPPWNLSVNFCLTSGNLFYEELYEYFDDVSMWLLWWSELIFRVISDM